MTADSGESTGQITAKKKRGRVENLSPPWPKGVSGNPGGRPKKIITNAYEDLANQKVPNDAKGRTYAQLLAEGQFRSAIKGKTDAAREITDRLEGKPLQSISGPDGGAIPHTIEGIDEYIMELVRSVQDQTSTPADDGRGKDSTRSSTRSKTKGNAS